MAQEPARPHRPAGQRPHFPRHLSDGGGAARGASDRQRGRVLQGRHRDGLPRLLVERGEERLGQPAGDGSDRPAGSRRPAGAARSRRPHGSARPCRSRRPHGSHRQGRDRPYRPRRSHGSDRTDRRAGSRRPAGADRQPGSRRSGGSRGQAGRAGQPGSRRPNGSLWPHGSHRPNRRTGANRSHRQGRDRAERPHRPLWSYRPHGSNRPHGSDRQQGRHRRRIHRARLLRHEGGAGQREEGHSRGGRCLRRRLGGALRHLHLRRHHEPVHQQRPLAGRERPHGPHRPNRSHGFDRTGRRAGRGRSTGRCGNGRDRNGHERRPDRLAERDERRHAAAGRFQLRASARSHRPCGVQGRHGRQGRDRPHGTDRPDRRAGQHRPHRPGRRAGQRRSHRSHRQGRCAGCDRPDGSYRPNGFHGSHRHAGRGRRKGRRRREGRDGSHGSHRTNRSHGSDRRHGLLPADQGDGADQLHREGRLRLDDAAADRDDGRVLLRHPLLRHLERDRHAQRQDRHADGDGGPGEAVRRDAQVCQDLRRDLGRHRHDRVEPHGRRGGLCRPCCGGKQRQRFLSL